MAESTQEIIDTINKMPSDEMVHLWRFAPAGHPYFDGTLPYFKVFDKRFRKLGGISSKILKRIGY